jgi:ABC-type transporter lipoprotein component MlaA
VIEAQLDPYVFVREYYLRRREDKVEDRTPVEPLSID